MLIETTALDMYPVSKYNTIEDRISEYKENFCQELLRIVHQRMQDSKEYPVSISGLDNYTVFRNMYRSHRPVKFNNKNVTFETNEGLWNYFKWYLERKQHPDFQYLNQDGDCAPICTGEDDIEFYDEDIYHNFFGPGEFPIIIFNVIRIGNQEYTFWDISR